jgi:hypothetical protein
MDRFYVAAVKFPLLGHRNSQRGLAPRALTGRVQCVSVVHNRHSFVTYIPREAAPVLGQRTQFIALAAKNCRAQKFSETRKALAGTRLI